MLGQMDSGQSKNRNFICSCQKAYLSYAALFTHIKQKHGGKAPGQIVRPRSLNKRGRPRKSEKPGNQRGVKSESYNGLSSGDNNNNNKRAIINNNSHHSNYISSEIQSIYLPSSAAKDNGRGFKSYKNSIGSRQQPTPIAMTKRQSAVSHYQQCNDELLQHDQLYENNNNNSSFQQEEFQDENMEFSNINNQFSNNTLTLASIIIGLQQTFKQATGLEIVRDQRLEYFASYGDLKKYHALKLSLSPEDKKDEDVFMLGNVICAFLNFCHQTLDNKASYQQIVFLMVCLLDHIKSLQPYSSPQLNILTECRKQVIHQSLPSFFEQYLQKVLVRYRMKYWIFRQNNSFKVLIWFLNWLSAIEVNYLKSSMVQEKRDEKKQDQQQQKGMVVRQEGGDKLGMCQQVDVVVVGQVGVKDEVCRQEAKQCEQQQHLQQEVNNVQQCQLNKQQQLSQSQQQQQQQLLIQQDQPQVQFENPVFFNNHNVLNSQINNLTVVSNIQKQTQQDRREQLQQSVSSSSSSSPHKHSSPQSSSSSQQQQSVDSQQIGLIGQNASQQSEQREQQPQHQESQQNNENMISNGLERLSSEVR